MPSRRDQYYLDLVPKVADLSTCVRRKVSAIIVDEKGRILSTGYNGVPSGFPHCIDRPCLGADDPSGDSSRCYAVHAEINALIQCSELRYAHTMYCSCSPCFSCAKAIANTSIKRIVFLEQYADINGLELLEFLGVQMVNARDL